nr:phospholipase [Micromonospora sp. DSM 115978]
MLDDWFLTAPERRNPDTAVDLRHADRQAWTTGNVVTPLVHGTPYFRRLLDETHRLGPDDLLLFTDWRGDADQRLDADEGTTVGELLSGAAERGVLVRGLVWRSHLAALSFSEKENRELAEDANTSGAHVVLDHRVRRSGSHHQKLVVIRRDGSPDDAVAFAGGIDLCYSRRDDADHEGDPQSQPMADAYGERPPWHDIQCEVRGPAVGDLEATFRERWDDPTRLDTPNPMRKLFYKIRPTVTDPDPLPPQQPDPSTVGPHAVQV